jgi:hypothetical protein
VFATVKLDWRSSGVVVVDGDEWMTECWRSQSINLIALSSFNKSMMSYIYRVIIAKFTEQRSARFLNDLNKLQLLHIW